MAAHPALAANSSARRAFVNTPTLIAKSVVKTAMIPSFFLEEETEYKLTMPPIRRAAALTVLRMATKPAMRRSET